MKLSLPQLAHAANHLCLHRIIVLMFGLFPALLLSANLMHYIAIHFSIPVSTMQDLVGKRLFVDRLEGHRKYLHVMWFVSPLVAGGIGMVLFGMVKFW